MPHRSTFRFLYQSAPKVSSIYPSDFRTRLCTHLNEFSSETATVQLAHFVSQRISNMAIMKPTPLLQDDISKAFGLFQRPKVASEQQARKEDSAKYTVIKLNFMRKQETYKAMPMMNMVIGKAMTNAITASFS